jgi:hypothetical protein
MDILRSHRRIIPEEELQISWPNRVMEETISWAEERRLMEETLRLAAALKVTLIATVAST